MVEAAEKIDSREDVGGVLAVQAETDSLLGAQGDVHGVMGPSQFVQAHVPAHLDAALQLDSQVEDLLDFRVEHRLGQAVTGDAPAQHAAGLLQGLEHRHAVASASQLIRAGEAAGACADDGDLLRPFLLREDFQFQPSFDAEIADGPLDLVDVHGALELLAVALDLARGGADSAADRGERTGVRVDRPGLCEGLLEGFAQTLRECDGRAELANAVAAGAAMAAGGLLLHLLGAQRRLLPRPGPGAPAETLLLFDFLYGHRPPQSAPQLR